MQLHKKQMVLEEEVGVGGADGDAGFLDGI